MTLSILCITYNHEAFIKEAINSFLMQKTNFDFEIVIGEDHSTDNTLQICLDYQKKYPGKIRLLQREKNLGVMPNLIDTFSHCTGKYIAFCEGDDYWTDTHKLQKQVDFLEANPEYSICCHNIYFLINNKIQLNTQWDTPETTDLKYLLRKGNYLTSLSVVYRRHADMLPFLERFRDSSYGDYLMHISAALHGKIHYMKKRMAVYRAHSGGIWSGIEQDKGMLKVLLLTEMVHDRMPTEYRDDLKIQLAGWLDAIIKNEELFKKLSGNSEFARILNNMSIPSFLLEYLKFSSEQRSWTSYFSKHVPFPVLLNAMRKKISHKVQQKYIKLSK